MTVEAELLGRFQRGELAANDPASALLLGCEGRRQQEKLVMIPSESMAPRAVLEVLGSVYTNLYAEGYPSERMIGEQESELADYAWQEALHRRFADRRFYKGTEFANLVETLARKRVAELFAADGSQGVPVAAGQIHANVQALSGAAANNAVYEACLQPGDTLMGMNLSHGGHLSHGSPYNRSGKYYKIVPYGVSSQTGRLDYDDIERLAKEHHPKMIVAGASAYPWDIDWRRLRAIADEVPGRALLLADIAHPAGLVVAGLFPNPVGYADVVTFTTHKTMIGPRGAVILTTSEYLARHIDRAVFPGEQGGPHVNNIAAMAVAFKLAQSEVFRELQRRIVANAQALAASLQSRDMRLAYGGTSTHLLLVDLNAVRTASGVPLKGDVAARLLDLAGIVCNKNTIPGDLNASHSSAIRLGTVWATQRGLTSVHMDRLAGVIHDLLNDVRTFAYVGATGPLWRGKVELPVMRQARQVVQSIVEEVERASGEASSQATPRLASSVLDDSVLLVRGLRAQAFLQTACVGDVVSLAPGNRLRTYVLDGEGHPLAQVEVSRPADFLRADQYLVAAPAPDLARLKEWFEALSDGYTLFDRVDVFGKVEGPVVVEFLDRETVAKAGGLSSRAAEVQQEPAPAWPDLAIDLAREAGLSMTLKPYFVGENRLVATEAPAKPPFSSAPYTGEPRPSALYEEHRRLTAPRNLIPFAGWSMPVWYTSIAEEHRAVRQTAGLFDVSHMGVLEVSGEHAVRFLELLTTNSVAALRPGHTQYAYVLSPDGGVLDDVLIYCLALDRFMLVVNAANAEKVKSWFDAVNGRAVGIDFELPSRQVDVGVVVRDLKDPAAGQDRRVDLSLQGPQSLPILLAAIPSAAQAAAVRRLRRSEFVRASVRGVDALVSRTGYTGEEHGYELYVHSDKAPEVWRLLLAVGAPYGLKPAGLGARDSTRTEAGFPLYGHELAGPHDVTPEEAGYGSFVKLHKPYFVGRTAYLRRAARRTMEVARFALGARGVRMTKTGDLVLSKRGEVIGHVTSAVAVDGQQIGMAYLDRRYAEAGTPLGILSVPRETERVAGPSAGPVKPGDRLQIPEPAVVLSRFPRKA